MYSLLLEYLTFACHSVLYFTSVFTAIHFLMDGRYILYIIKNWDVLSYTLCRDTLLVIIINSNVHAQTVTHPKQYPSYNFRVKLSMMESSSNILPLLFSETPRPCVLCKIMFCQSLVFFLLCFGSGYCTPHYYVWHTNATLQSWLPSASMSTRIRLVSLSILTSLTQFSCVSSQPVFHGYLTCVAPSVSGVAALCLLQAVPFKCASFPVHVFLWSR